MSHVQELLVFTGRGKLGARIASAEYGRLRELESSTRLLRRVFCDENAQPMPLQPLQPAPMLVEMPRLQDLPKDEVDEVANQTEPGMISLSVDDLYQSWVGPVPAQAQVRWTGAAGRLGPGSRLGTEFKG